MYILQKTDGKIYSMKVTLSFLFFFSFLSLKYIVLGYFFPHKSRYLEDILPI